ncbi:hypothetical protein ABPG75_006161 [Micractinium tetrahymenae]
MRSPRLAARGKEGRDPNQEGAAPVPYHKRGALAPLEGSPAKKKPSKKDRRRVSFAPDPELTLIHHFVKDDDYSANSDGKGPVVVAYDEEPTVAQQLRPQHPALVGAVPEAGAADGAPFPGFWSRAVPENSPLADVPAAPAPVPPLPDSPGMVSMELTQPTLAVQAPAQHVAGEVTAGLPSLGALAEADEEEDAAAGPAEQQHAAGWAHAAALADVTAGNITAALPGLGSLVEEDEEDAAGMDLTVPAGRVLEHHPQVQQAAVADAEAAEPVGQPQQQGSAQGEQWDVEPLVPDGAEAPTAEAEAEAAAPALPAGRRSMGRFSLGGGSTDELAREEAARAAQLNKWGFAPGQDDTLDINLEMHGRMIMGDQTFNRMYCDNTTGDGGYGRSAGADDTSSPLLLAAGGDSPAPAATQELAVAAASPAGSQGVHQQAAPSPAVSHGARHAAAGAAAEAAPVPNWTAPAFLPPYLQAPAASGAPSDHPALVHSPDVTGSSLNTLGTRRVSVGVADARRASINSRRFSMQDATGRLLADDDLLSPGGSAGQVVVAAPVEEALPAARAGGPPSTAGRARRRSSGAAFLTRDVTEKLLIDDESMEGEEQGPLADLRRQMRMLSQGSPVLVPQPQALAAAAAVAEEEAAEELAAAAAPAAVADAAQPAAGAGLPGAAAKTPRAAVSMGYADSHNPATARLLRSGGTTRLLQDSLGMGGDEEDDLLAEEAGEHVAAGSSAQALALADAGGVTACTNGTTKLLADMTMASMVGVKLLGRPAQGTPELAHQPSSDGLTDFSLDEFEPPPELPARQAEATEAADMQQADPAADATAQEELRQQQHLQEQAGGYASPALAPGGADFGTGYPIDHAASGDAIPGGPKLARTPVTARPASQPRPAAQATPLSNARSLRSQQQLHQHVTPGTHGTHRLARTPASGWPPAAAYPVEADVAAGNVIPGGPKLARTPVGRTPATGGFHGAPGSAVAQHYPGSARAVHFAAGPGSASVQRYPGSAVAAHRAGGMTPQYSAPPPMTFQDFARLTEVQFLDNLRRGTSINYADLQPNPVPASLADAYRLLTIISPQVTTLENGIRILQEEVQSRRVTAADAEQLVGQVNPAAFQKAATADDEGLEALREHVGLLKKVCRQKAVYCLKDVRRQMEESRGARLLRNLEALRGDVALAQDCKEQLEGVAKAAEHFVAEQHRRMAQEDAALEQEAEKRGAVVRMRQAISEETATNEQRRAQLAEVQQRVAKLREEHAAWQREREALRSRTDALQMTLMQTRGQDGGLAQESSPAGILQKLEQLDALKRCVGWELEGAAEDPVSGEVALRLGGLFRMRLGVSRAGASVSVEVLPEEECKVPADQQALLAALAGCAEGSAELPVADAKGPTVAALVQATTARLSRVADLAGELDGLRLAFPALTEVACTADGAVSLSFVNLDAEVKFAVSLQLPRSYPLGRVHHAAKIWFGDAGQISEQRIAQAVYAAPEAPGRLRAICQQLSQLAQEALPRPALGRTAAANPFSNGWGNPLFGSTPALSAHS